MTGSRLAARTPESAGRGLQGPTRGALARAVLAADGLGCAGAAAVVLGSKRVASAVDPTMTSRRQLAVALTATSALLLAGAARTRPTDGDLERAALVNTGWVLLCAVGLSRRPPGLGAALIGCTAVLDGAAALAHWQLRAAASRTNTR